MELSLPWLELDLEVDRLELLVDDLVMHQPYFELKIVLEVELFVSLSNYICKLSCVSRSRENTLPARGSKSRISCASAPA